ncbi:hypothetical protein BT69DRAFT_1280902 [Atractiella rhizophila]|nr:hypothetical protein BT69DRAFT_1280902 [Atractiella rhizophila]
MGNNVTMNYLPPELLIDILTQLCLDQDISNSYLASLRTVSRIFHEALSDVLFRRRIALTSKSASFFKQRPRICLQLRNLLVDWRCKIEHSSEVLRMSPNLKALDIDCDTENEDDRQFWSTFSFPQPLANGLVALTLNILQTDGTNYAIGVLSTLVGLRHLSLNFESVWIPNSHQLSSSLISLDITCEIGIYGDTGGEIPQHLSYFFERSISSLRHLSLPAILLQPNAQAYEFIAACSKQLEFLRFEHISMGHLPPLPKLVHLSVSNFSSHAVGFAPLIPNVGASVDLVVLDLSLISLEDFQEVPWKLRLQHLSLTDCGVITTAFSNSIEENCLRSLEIHATEPTWRERQFYSLNEGYNLILRAKSSLRNLSIRTLTGAAQVREAISHCTGLVSLTIEKAFPENELKRLASTIRYLFVRELDLNVLERFLSVLEGNRARLPNLAYVHVASKYGELLSKQDHESSFGFSMEQAVWKRWRTDVETIAGLSWSRPLFSKDMINIGFT